MKGRASNDRPSSPYEDRSIRRSGAGGRRSVRCSNGSTRGCSKSISPTSGTLSPAKMIQLLEPLKDVMQSLSLEMYDLYGDGRIGSLRHMVALRALSTGAEMWHNITVEEFQPSLSRHIVSEDADRLSDRLPPFLTDLVFTCSGSTMSCRGVAMLYRIFDIFI
jgi:hypothetical protein